MSLLNSVQETANATGEKDTLGGGGFILPTMIYPAKIEQAFLTKSPNGAIALNLRAKVRKDDGTLGEHRETIYFTNRAGETSYQKNGETHMLPGFITVNALAQLVTGKGLKSLPTTQQTVGVWNGQVKKEVPTQVEALPDLCGEVYLGIQQIKENKTEKGGDGKYHPINKPRELNAIDKVFRVSDKLTLPEVLSGATEAKFFVSWTERFAGKVYDKYKADAPASAPGAASPMAAGTAVAGAPMAAAPANSAAPSGLFA
jgi:hypothetical protein